VEDYDEDETPLVFYACSWDRRRGLDRTRHPVLENTHPAIAMNSDIEGFGEKFFREG
jgi:hypothetical protein